MSLLSNNGVGAVLYYIFPSTALTHCGFGSFLLKAAIPRKKIFHLAGRGNFWLWQNWYIVESNATINTTSCAQGMFASCWKLEKGDLVWLQFTINLWKGAENSSPFLLSWTLLVHSFAVLLSCSFSCMYTVLVDQWEAWVWGNPGNQPFESCDS